MNPYELAEYENEDYYCDRCGCPISTEQYLDSGLCDECFDEECEVQDLKAEFLALGDCEKCEEKWNTNNCQIPFTKTSGCSMWQSFLMQRENY